MNATGRAVRRHALVLLSYAALACALTWPLLAHLATHVPGDGGDDPALVWNLWWVPRALSEWSSPFDCDFMFYPIGINLAFYTLTVLNGALSLPLQSLLGLIPASNLVLLSSYVIGGYGAFLLARHVLGGRQWWAAWLAGLVYAFAAPKLFYAALGQFNIASSQWVPFAALYMVRGARSLRPRDFALAALFTALQAWAEMTYASFLLVFLGFLVLYRLADIALGKETRLWRSAARLLGGAVLMGLVLGLLIAPMLAAMLPDMIVEGDFSVVGGGFADVFSADLAGFLVPTMLHPLLGSLVGQAGFEHFDKGQHLYFGLSLWVLVAVALARGRRSAGFWGLASLGFLLLALGPVLQVNGARIEVPMPFQVTQALPFFKANRYPSRYVVMLALTLSVLAAQGLRLLARGGPAQQRWLGLAFASLFLLENLSAPLPLSDMRVPALYERVRQTPGDFAVLEVPLAWRNGFRITGTADVAIMFSQYYQTYHGKRLIGGNTSRNPELKFQYFAEMPVLGSLVALEAGRPVAEADLARDRQMAADVLAVLGVRYVVVRTDIVDEAVRRYVEQVLPVRLVAEEGGRRLYAVRERGPAPAELDPRLVLAEGWGARTAPAPAVRPRARLLLPAGEAGADVTLRLRGLAEGDTVSVVVRGTALARFSLTEEWQDYRFSLPGSGRPGEEVWLVAERGHSPSSLGAHRAIGDSGTAAPVDVYVRSAGEEFGSFGRVYVGGVEVGISGRGYNVVAVDGATGEVLSVAAFDTHADRAAAGLMAAHLRSLPAGAVVAVAAADEASRLLDEEAVAALRGIGATADLRGCFRCGHAVVGAVGLAAGEAAEDWGYGVRQAVAGRGITGPRVYFELGGVGLSPRR